MGIQLATQTQAFLLAGLLGAFLGALYDVFRILRVAFPTGPRAVFIQDVVFFALCAVATFFYLLTAVDGVVRVFLILGELIGAVLYYFTLGQLVMMVSKTIIQGVKAVLRFVFRCIVQPIWKLMYGIVAIILFPVRFLCDLMKKLLRKMKFRLKIHRIVLYNQSIRLHKRHKPSEEGKG